MTKEMVLQKKSILDVKVADFFNDLLLALFLLNAILIPNDTFNIKILSLILLVAFNMLYIINKKGEEQKIVIFAGIALPILLMLWSIILTKNIIDNIRYGYVLFILVLLSVVLRKGLHFKALFIFALRSLAFITIILFVLDYSNIIPLSANGLAQFLHDSDNAMIGKTSASLLGYVIFLKTSPLLLFLMIYDLKNGKYLLAFFTLIALMFSGTRANALIAIAVFVGFILFFEKNKNIKIILIGIIIIAFLMLSQKIIGKMIELFDSKEGSDAVRNGHLQGILETWKNNPLTFFIGVGYTSEFYSYGIDDYTYNIELSYWNLLRQTGLIGFILIMAIFIYPMIKLSSNKEKRCFILAQLGYMIISYTNPFLFSSTGVLMILFMYYLVYEKSKDDGEIRYVC